jgi:hypothetical protein
LSWHCVTMNKFFIVYKVLHFIDKGLLSISYISVHKNNYQMDVLQEISPLGNISKALYHVGKNILDSLLFYLRLHKSISI